MKNRNGNCRILLLYAIAVFACGAFAHGEEKVKIALAGDSTVANYKPGDNIAGWGQMIRLFLSDSCEVENLAVGGRSTKTFIEEGHWSKLMAGKPQFVLIQFGHNDSHGKDKPESTVADGNYKDFLRKYVDDAKAASITPVFITPMHRRLFDKSGVLSAELKTYADAMKEVAIEKGVFCVDLHESSGRLLKELGESKSEPLYRPSDRTHFSHEGAYTMAGLIAKDLKKPESPVKDFCREVPLMLPAGQAEQESYCGWLKIK
ncbi:MAG: rhamnogalacturonan acetylesterase [Lentisphaerota bacterium]